MGIPILYYTQLTLATRVGVRQFSHSYRIQVGLAHLSGQPGVAPVITGAGQKFRPNVTGMGSHGAGKTQSSYY